MRNAARSAEPRLAAPLTHDLTRSYSDDLVNGRSHPRPFVIKPIQRRLVFSDHDRVRPWMLLLYLGVNLVLPVFTEFYWVSLSITALY